eukprot:TRINITY_DN16554_c0_g1_i1.p1 TRINITY_DN16554_c0_g1~~TRINITY_DN16554_c0_g1_i1.p1  ORF type:complete len:755 (+),score=162.85 TRINITY_DN16554_c0_g1_i1:54-2267(+)
MTGEQSGLLKGSATQKQSRVKIRLQNLCCEMELTLVDKVLGDEKAVLGYNSNILGKSVDVKFVDGMITAAEITQKLNTVNLGASIKEGARDGKDHTLSQQILNELTPTAIFWVAAGEIVALATYFATGNDNYIAAAVLLGVADLFWKTLSRAVRSRTVSADMQTLMLLAAIGAVYLNKAGEAVTMLVLYSTTHILQQVVLSIARFKVDSCGASVLPNTATLHSTGKDVPISSLRAGTKIFVRSGECIPVDGTVFKDTAYVDEAAVTGESKPKRKTVGSEVLSGSIIQDGALGIVVTRIATTSTAAQIQDMVEEAASSKTEVHSLLDKLAKYYSNTIIIVSALVALLPLITGSDWGECLHRAIVLLVLGCPCALVTAGPIVTTCGVAAAAGKGVLIKEASVLDSLRSATAICFDKTGTATDGQFSPIGSWQLPGSTEEDVKKVIALELQSRHPLAVSLVSSHAGCMTEAVEELGVSLNLPEVSNFKIIEGCGVSGTSGNDTVSAGNLKWVKQCGASITPSLQQFIDEQERLSRTLIFGVVRNTVIKAWALFDTPREGAQEAIHELSNLGVQSLMLSGDAPNVVKSVGEQLGVTRSEGGMLPEDKVKRVAQLKDSYSTGREDGNDEVVIMVGDGINDAPALAAADIGWAMGAGGTALAAQAASVIEVRNRLLSIPEAIQLSRKCSTLLKQNVFVSVFPKLSLATVALFYPAFTVPLWVAVLADSGCLLFVVLNGCRVFF